jgi:hypothetical protein
MPDLGTQHAISIGLNHFHHRASLRPGVSECLAGELNVREHDVVGRRVGCIDGAGERTVRTGL